ncbi:FMN-binding negative transcriptional regulator [Leeuwenhoekiella sp. NPDC079379]|uniref:FMN-binding negative transcriptional regulator n=1 Tax=Leeuwenhoekiella sp. NPDC079379 TaxID=3364122 RepID=UPI0037C8F068
MSLYPPPHHQESGFANAIKTLQTFPLALLITTQNDVPLLTHLPLIYKVDDGLGKLLGHIDNNNPQLQHIVPGAKVTLVFNGPDSYISPAIYTTPQLPTWNYIKVHLEGKILCHQNNDELKNAMVELTHTLEGDQQQFTLNKDDSRMEAFVNYVTGFEIEITSWEGKFKLSQDKLKKDQEKAKSALKSNYSAIMNDYVDLIYKKHITKSSLK